MTQRELIKLFQDILKTIQLIEKFLSEVEFNEFESNEEKIFAVTRAIEIIGEAVKNIPQSIRDKYSNIPWKAIAGMHDKLIHEYWQIDVGIIWKTTQEDIPILKALIIRIINESQNN